ncbi:MAG: hypothetical protein IJK56_10995 [Firmicutes bacterium]|nr:hypothetical protein [Bacillota bacterium]
MKEIIITLVCSIFASTGFWAFVTTLINNHKAKASVDSKLLLGLAHDRICSLCEEYIDRGSISKDEYENLYDYLYVPYEKKGGNGSAKRLMEEVKRLPLRS